MANKDNKQKHNYIFYGTKTTASEVDDFIQHVITTCERAEAQGRKKTPVCIWGKHGIGKTQLVEAIAQERGYKWAYIAPAQFEEMGDLVGMPRVRDGVTEFVAPDWVPKEEGPGILLIDDANRADDRILRGIMQLLQNYELVSWKLPKGWHIILTANPDGGDYSVTPMDDAMLTRMMHITMEFDVKEWAKWAELNGVDPRGINFVLTYPEMVTGERTTPRTLVQFFESISTIKELDKNLGLVQLLADSCLDSNTVASFMAFINNNLSKLITPEEIINAKNFKTQVLDHLKSIVVKGTLRVDILATLCTRLVNYLTINKTKPSKEQLKNIKDFIKIDFIPNDIRLSMAQDLVGSSNTHLRMIMADPQIGKLLLKRM
ncbi:MAG: AAA family ATPase [Saprospiraceae bacterium]|nr:AAA family ATPase [Saprospiraceae bacterium]